MDCKVPVMFTYLGIIIIFSTFGHAYAETTVFNIDSVIKNQLTKCGNDTIVREGDTMKLTFQSPSRYVNLAFCNNVSTKNLNTKLNISNGKTITFDIVGREEYEGLWNCSFLTHIDDYVRDSVTYDRKYYAPYANCSLMVRIKRDVTLTVSSTTTTNLVTANATDIGYYRFIEGNKITIECKKGHTNGTFLQSENLIFKICRKDKSCADLKTNSTLVRDTMELNSTFDGSILHCIYNNSVGYQTDAEIVLQIKAQSVRSVDETTVTQMPSDSESSTDIIFEGKIGERRSYVCKSKHWKETSTVHWEFCDEYGLNCSCSDARFGRLSQNITLAEGSNGTVAKCVLSFEHYDYNWITVTKAKTIRLYAYHPPKLTNKDGVEFQSYNTDNYVVEGTDGENIIIRCFNRQYTGALFWRTCNDTTSELCETEDGTKCNMIEKSLWLKPDLNGKLLYCVFKTDRGHEIATKATFVIHPKTQSQC